jgi:hypothetical protein
MYVNNPVTIPNNFGNLGFQVPSSLIGNPVQPSTPILASEQFLEEQKPELPSINEFVSSGLIAQIVPIEIINNALKEHSKESQRIRLLPSPTIVYFIMAMNIWRDDSQEEVLKNICQGLKNIDPSFTFDTFPTRAAISKARIRLGASVMESLAT